MRTNQSLIALLPASPEVLHSNGPVSQLACGSPQNGASTVQEQSGGKPPDTLLPASPAVPHSDGPVSQVSCGSLQNGASTGEERSGGKALTLQSNGVSMSPHVAGPEGVERVCLPHVIAEEEGLFLELDAGHVFKLEVAV